MMTYAIADEYLPTTRRWRGVYLGVLSPARETA